MVETTSSAKAKGGKARAKKLSASKRSAIAKKAAASRWADLPVAVCATSEGQPLRIADIELECYVLEDGTRLLSQAGFLSALGRHRKANVRRERVPAILQGKAISPFICEDTLEKSTPIAFRTPYGSRASGYRADLLPEVCEVYLKARDANALPPNQIHVAKQADILMRGLAHVGIIALVDEATGYQDVRARNALALILEQFIAKELQAWVRTFPDDYYKGMFRLRGLQYPEDNVKRPQYFGTLTNEVVYARLAPGVLDELKKVTPRSDAGNLRHKFFQHLTTNTGYPKLREHLGSVVTIMKLSNSWREFKENLDRIHPRYGNTIPMELIFDDDGRGL